METKEYTLYFVPVPMEMDGIHIRSDFYDFLEKHRDKFPIYASSIELGEEETVEDLKMMIEHMVEEAQKYVKFQVQAE